MSRSLPLAPLVVAMLWVMPGCKVPLSDINAAFSIADAAWFAEEETLFVFYEVEAEQGLGPASRIEIRYTTDNGVVDWTPLTEFAFVHPHLPIDCGVRQRCGSASLHVPLRPRNVGIRLRYHRDGDLSLDAETVFNIVGQGPPHTHRSLLVYGVFDGTNRAVQWRARHRFPTIRNEDAQRLGLRRRFTINDQRYGSGDLGSADDNPYAYGVTCPSAFSPFTPFASLDMATVDTEDRAVFNPDDLPDMASEASEVCAEATVYGPNDPFLTGALARKNPEVRPAFPLLRSPVRDALPLKYLLSVCNRTLSEDHLEMQTQRLLMSDATPICIDDAMDGAFIDTLSARIRDDIEAARAQGRDMVLVLALHHDSMEFGGQIEGLLDGLLGPERLRTTPRVAGAFVLDSFIYTVTQEQAARTVIWCPTELPLDLPDIFGGGEDADAGVDEESPKDAGVGENLNTASLACAILPDNPDLSLGPFSFGALPIFPSRQVYLDFINDYSTRESGTMKSLSFRVPELPPSAEHVFAGPFGVATFLNGEVITAQPDDAFSYCESDEYQGFVFRDPIVMEPLPIASLPEFHSALPADTYQLGVFWDFPYLLRIRYETVTAGSISAFSASLPFGIASTTDQNFGSELWLEEEFPLAETLTQCERYCDHPTFDAAGIYQVNDDFRGAYAAACYAPKFPQRGDSGFPSDP